MSNDWLLVTGNENKWREAQAILGRPLERLALDLPELQLPTVREVALEKVRAAYAQLQRPVIVEDAGLEFKALNGFPGPFIKFWEKLGGLDSLCRAADGFKDRRISAVCALAFWNGEGEPRVLEGRVDGTVSDAPRGNKGFGWDAVFIRDGETRTFGELTPAEKDSRSHRRTAWELLKKELLE